MPSRILVALLLLLCAGEVSGTARAAAPPAQAHTDTLPRGLPVAEALARLRERGLSLIFSDRVVTPELRLQEQLARLSALQR